MSSVENRLLPTTTTCSSTSTCTASSTAAPTPSYGVTSAATFFVLASITLRPFFFLARNCCVLLIQKALCYISMMILALDMREVVALIPNSTTPHSSWQPMLSSSFSPLFCSLHRRCGFCEALGPKLLAKLPIFIFCSHNAGSLLSQ